jgi:predicted MFS family arabinose efflux permease
MKSNGGIRAMSLDTGATLTYRRLFSVGGFAQLAGGVVLSRTAIGLIQVALVLYVLQTFHSPALAGLVVFLSLVPGLAVSPIAGALLDRHGRVRMILLDYCVAASTMVLLAGLAAAQRLSAPLLMVIVAISSLTGPLSASGNRSLFPLVVPSELWDRANAVDSGSQALAMVIGPALAGGLIAWVGGPGAFIATALLFGLAAVLLIGFTDPQKAHGPAQPLLISAWQALLYVLKHPTLRGIVLTLWCANLAFGAVLVGLPLLVFMRFHWGADAVGNLWALSGVATVASGLYFGRMRTQGRERVIVAFGMGVSALAILLMVVSATPVVLLISMLLAGASAAPMDLGLFALRQRRTDPAWFGRVIAVSMSLNYAGSPIGSALAGPLLARSLTLALGLGAAVSALGIVMPFIVIPREG